MNLQNYGDKTRDSTASNMTMFPGGLESPKSNAFANKTHGTSTTAGEDFSFLPPRLNFDGDRYRDSGASDVTIFPGAPAGTPSSDFGSPGRGVGHAQDSSRNGPNGRKLSSPQDMTWLNLNNGKPL
jgi:hypothetical protein